MSFAGNRLHARARFISRMQFLFQGRLIPRIESTNRVGNEVVIEGVNTIIEKGDGVKI